MAGEGISPSPFCNSWIPFAPPIPVWSFYIFYTSVFFPDYSLTYRFIIIYFRSFLYSQIVKIKQYTRKNRIETEKKKISPPGWRLKSGNRIRSNRELPLETIPMKQNYRYICRSEVDIKSVVIYFELSFYLYTKLKKTYFNFVYLFKHFDAVLWIFLCHRKCERRIVRC